ncbi:hypothetical protein ABKA04_004881 [Annulohypoxylon sp. FPYF3050]
MMSLDPMDDFMEDVLLQEGLRPTIAEHAAQCNSLFRRYIVLSETVPDPTIMDDQLARFKLWTSNMDVFGPPNVSLDYRLRFSPTIVDIIHQLLKVIYDTLTSFNNKLSFPPVPPTQECPYCGIIVEFKNVEKSTLWNDHVIGDLEPFICVFPQCLETIQHEAGPLTFESSKAWIGHMQISHGHKWECRAPSHDPIIFDQETQYQEHSIQEHGVPEAYVGTLTHAARRTVLDKFLECPFGDDFQSPENAEPSAVFSSEALQLHVAAHQKEIALLTLQKLRSDEDENAEDIDSNQPLEDDGTGLAKLRGSMYSILEDEDLDFQDSEPEASIGTRADRGEDMSASVSIPHLENKDYWKLTKLHHAVGVGDLGLVESFISEGVNLGSRDKHGRTALHYACMGSVQYKYCLDMMTLLLNTNGKAIMNLGDNNGQTPLHYAAQRDLTDRIQTLVSYGADTLATDIFGLSPLLWAVVSGKTNATLMLLDNHVDPDSTNAGGKSALAWAAGLGRYTIAKKLLFEYGAGMYNQNTQMVPLEEAAASGHIRIVQLLLDKGGDPNYRGRDGWSAIHWAAEEGHLEIVRKLLDHRAEVNTVSSYGTSPLHCAANGGHVSIVRLLLGNGADPLKSTCHGWTALHHAAFMGHSDVVRLLLEDERVRSNISQQDNHGCPVMEEALAFVDDSGLTAEEWLNLGPTSHSYKATSNVPMMNLFFKMAQDVEVAHDVDLANDVDADCDVNGMNSGRRTALYYAAKKRNLSIMDLLLDFGADPYILPTGRKAWEEFISDEDVIHRLNRAGYRRRDIDPEVERQIRLVLKTQGRSSIPNPSALLVPKENISTTSWQPTPPIPEQSSSPVPTSSQPSVPASSALPLTDHSTLSIPTLSVAPIDQTNDKKRKSETLRSRAKSFWRRLTR